MYIRKIQRSLLDQSLFAFELKKWIKNARLKVAIIQLLKLARESKRRSSVFSIPEKNRK